MDVLDALYVAQRMRAADAREIWATRWNEDPHELARDAVACAPVAWTACKGHVPVACIGAGPLHPGVWRVWMYATDDFPSVGMKVTKFARRVMIPALLHAGAHRAECLSIDGHDQAHRWLEALGAAREATLGGYGRDGEDFHLYAWRRGHGSLRRGQQ